MKKVLIADDHSSIRAFIKKILQPYENIIETILVEDGRQAADKLDNDQIDLLVTDLYMPKMSGFELLLFVKERHSDIPVFVITASEADKKTKTLGTIKYFKKPIDRESFVNSVLDQLNENTSGQIRGITLISFLQLLEMEQKTCSVKVESMKKKGIFYFFKGDLTSASIDSSDGIIDGMVNEKAAIEMITWNGAIITLNNMSRKSKKDIQTPLMNLIMEGTRLKDERAIGEKKPSSVQKSPHKKMENSTTPGNKTNKQSELEKLLEVISNTPSVLKYGIFDENDILKEQHVPADKITEASPATFLQAVDKLKNIYNLGTLKYITLLSTDWKRYLLFQYFGSKIVINYKLGFKPLEFINALKNM